MVTEDTQQTTMDFQTVGIVPMTEEATEMDGELPPSTEAELPTETEEPIELVGDVVYAPEEPEEPDELAGIIADTSEETDD